MRTKLAALEARLNKHHPEPRRHSLDDYARVIEAITSKRPAMELRFDEHGRPDRLEYVDDADAGHDNKSA
jgi:hypothetical protein